MNALATAHRRLLTVEEFHKLGEANILTEDDRVELIEGEMIQMAPIGTRHAGTINLLVELFTRSAKGRAIVSVQNPVALPPLSEPQPDLALLKPRADYYRSKHAGADEMLLIVEVSDTTLAYDRDVKIPLYARHGIPEAWVIDLNTQAVTVFLDPADTGYRRVLTPARDSSIAPSQLPNSSIYLADLW